MISQYNEWIQIKIERSIEFALKGLLPLFLQCSQIFLELVKHLFQVFFGTKVNLESTSDISECGRREQEKTHSSGTHTKIPKI